MSSWQNKDIHSVIDHFNALHQLNLTVIDQIGLSDNSLYERSEKALDIYYRLMRLKKYSQKGMTSLSAKELDGLCLSCEEIIEHAVIQKIEDPDMCVRIVFDRLLEADLKKAEESYLKYKKLFENGYAVVYDKNGYKLISAIKSAYGIPVRIIDCMDYSYNELLNVPKACLIENSQKFKEIVNGAPENSAQYIDYRDIRDSIRGWTSREVIM